MSLGRVREAVRGERDAVALEERVAALESAVSKLKDSMEKVLMDVRAFLSELENPIDYLGQLGLDELAASVIEGKLREFETRIRSIIDRLLEEKLKSHIKDVLGDKLDGLPRGAASSRQPGGDAVTPNRKAAREGESVDGIIGLMSCAAYLARTFGRKGMEDFLDSHVRTGLITDELKEKLVQLALAMHSEGLPERVNASVTDHIMATHMLSRLVSGISGMDLVVLSLLAAKIWPPPEQENRSQTVSRDGIGRLVERRRRSQAGDRDGPRRHI